jgi:aspartyl aminopeptidase
MEQSKQFAKDLLSFIDDSPSKFHVVENLRKDLVESGYQELVLSEPWKLDREKKYFVTKNDSALVAFKTGAKLPSETGFKLIGAHTDAPTFSIKPMPEIKAEGSYLKINTEVYGGPIYNTWMDRPLSIAGRVCVKSDSPLKPTTIIVDMNKPLMIIPNLAIHFQREVNNGYKYNAQKDLLPLVEMINDEFEKENYLVKKLAEHIGVKAEEILDFELTLYEFAKGSLVGFNEEFISSGKLDDLAMVHAGIEALKTSKDVDSTNVMICFDNEEVGSRTKQGAASPMLKNILERICLSYGEDREHFMTALYKSFMISADMAHAVHPNYGEAHDPVTRPVINKGPVLKVNASQAYTTDGQSGAVFKALCQAADVNLQYMANRSDKRGGSTIGPISSTQLDIKSVDIGNPMFAMHSVRELGGVEDHRSVYKVFKTFFEA